MPDFHHGEGLSVPLQVRVRRGLLARVDAAARAAGVSRSEAVRRALSDWAEQRDVAEERRRRLAEGV